MRLPVVVFCGLLLVAAIPLHAQPPAPSGTVAGRRGAPVQPGASAGALNVNTIDPLSFRAIAARLPKGLAPKVDGVLKDPAWELAPINGGFYQREPHSGEPSTERTEFRVLYDDRTIYFGIWSFDSKPSGIHASEMKRDSGLTKGDRVAIVIDSLFDRRNGFYFATNPLGAEKDAQYTDNSRVRNTDWNAVWDCRTSIDDKGWYAEIAIPLSQLRFRSTIGEATWGLNVARSIVRKNEETYWVPYPREQGANGFAYLSNAGILRGLQDLRSVRRLEFVPFVAPQIGRDYATGQSTTKADRYGFDARVGLTERLTADLSFRTDFAQVEADQEVVNVTRFSLFFPEKRQFFTESAGLFNFGKPGVETGDFGPGLLPLFYTRQVGLYDGQMVPLLGGGRVTGRVGGVDLGLMNIETDELDVVSGGKTVHVPRANYTVLRVKRNVFARSSVGGVFLNRQGGGGAAFNRSFGFDVNLVMGRDARLTGLLARTITAGNAGNGYAGAIDFSYSKDRYNYDLTYLDVAKDFNAEMGYIRRTDTRNARIKAAWTPRPGWPHVRQVSVGGLVDHYTTHAGQTESRTEDGQLGVTFNDTSSLTVDVDRDFDLLKAPFVLGAGAVPIGGHRWTTTRVAYTSSPRYRVSGNGYVEIGSYYNGDKTTWNAAVSLLPRDTLLFDIAYNRNRITLPLAVPYLTTTVSTRVSYSFSPRLFVKGFVQYNDAKRQATLNLLLWSIYRPGSDFYVVYNQGWDTDLPSPHTTQVRNRSLSVKLTYWLSR